MKAMSRDPLASSKARKAERKADGDVQVINIKLAASTPPANKVKDLKDSKGGGFKKGGFRNAFGGDQEDVVEDVVGRGEHGHERAEGRLESGTEGRIEGKDEEESEDEEGMYDPRHPTGCWSGCPGR